MAEEQLGSELISQEELLKRYTELIKLAEQFNVKITETVDNLLKAQKAFDTTSNSQKELTDKERLQIEVDKQLRQVEKNRIKQEAILTESGKKIIMKTELTYEQTLRIFKSIPIKEWQTI